MAFSPNCEEKRNTLLSIDNHNHFRSNQNKSINISDANNSSTHRKFSKINSTIRNK